MSAINQLCSKAILLNSGLLKRYDSVYKVINLYNNFSQNRNSIKAKHFDIKIEPKVVLDNENTHTIVLHITFRLIGPIRNPRIGIGINSKEGIRLTTIFSETLREIPTLRQKEEKYLRITSEPIRLTPGQYSTKIALAEDGHDIETLEDIMCFNVPEYAAFNKSPKIQPKGLIYLKCYIKK